MEKATKKQPTKKKEDESGTIARLGQMYSKPWNEELEIVTSIFVPEDPMVKIRQIARQTTGGAY